MKLIAWLTREILKMLNQYADVASQPLFFPPHPVPGAMLSRSKECRAAKMGRQAFRTHMVFRETFLQIQPRLLQHLIRRNWIHGVLMSEPIHSSTAGQNEKPNTRHRIRDASPDRQPKVQSSLLREILRRTMEQTNNDCTSQIFILTNSPTQKHLLVGR